MTAHVVRYLVLGALAVDLGATTAAGQERRASDIVISRAGTLAPRIAPRENFTGVVRVLPLFDSTATTLGWCRG